MSNGRPLSIISRLHHIVTTIYYADGFDPVLKTLNGSKEEFEAEDSQQFLQDLLTLTSTFFGLPNRRLTNYEDQSWKNIGKNFIGWQDKHRWPLHLLSALFFIPLHVVTLPFKFFINLFKMYTEVAPQCLTDASLHGLKTVGGESVTALTQVMADEAPPWTKCKESWPAVLGLVPSAFFLGGTGLFGYLRFLGGTITSPVNSVRQAWETGYQRLGVAGRLAFSAFTIVAVCAIYALLVPLVTRLITLTVSSYLITHIPAGFILMVTGFIEKHPLLTHLGLLMQYIAHLLTGYKFLDQVAHLVTDVPELSAIGSVLGGSMAILGPPINWSIEWIRGKWYAPAPMPDTFDLEDLTGPGYRSALSPFRNLLSHTLGRDISSSMEMLPDIDSFRPLFSPSPGGSSSDSDSRTNLLTDFDLFDDSQFPDGFQVQGV